MKKILIVLFVLLLSLGTGCSKKEKYKDYTFYGTVYEDRWLGPQLSIEYIE